MLYMEIIAVWSENRKKHTNANFLVTSPLRFDIITSRTPGTDYPRARSHYRERKPRLPLCVELKARAKRHCVARGCTGVMFGCHIWWWSCHWALKGCCQLWQDRLQQECRLAPNRVANLHEELCGSAQRCCWRRRCCGMWRRVVRRVVSNVSQSKAPRRMAVLNRRHSVISHVTWVLES